MRLVVVADTPNQLANRLWTIASLIATAADRRAQLVNVAFSEYAHFFPATAADALCRYPERRARALRGPFARRWARRIVLRLCDVVTKSRLLRRAVLIVHSGYETTLGKSEEEKRELSCELDDPELAAELDRRLLVIASGPLVRNRSALAKHRDEVLHYFRPFPATQAKSDAVIGPLRERYDKLVGVHVRRTDYAQFENGAFFFSHDQYAAVMKEITQLFAGQRVGFVICSDEAVPDHPYATLEAHRGPGDVVADLLTLAGCDCIVGPPSTFSAWASFVGETPVAFLHDASMAPSESDFGVVGLSDDDGI